jgi:hypothetical protein
MSWVAAGSAIGSVVGTVGSAILGKQKAPAYVPPASIGQIATDTTNANLQNFNANSKLAAETNQFDMNQAISLMNQAIPGFSQIQKNLISVANQDFSGQLPSNVLGQIQQQAAEQGVSSGASGGFTNNNLFRSLGISQLNWDQASQSMGLNALQSVFGSAPRISAMSPMSMFVTPQQAQNQSNYQTSALQSWQNAQTAAANYNAQLMGKAFGSLANFAGTAASSLFGGGLPNNAGSSGISQQGTYSNGADAAVAGGLGRIVNGVYVSNGG